jgi:hypothetical protein
MNLRSSGRITPMPKEPQERKEIAARPAPPGITNRTIEQWNPADLNPELANIAMAKLLVEKMGRPSRISKEFVSRKAIAITLNHIPEQYEERMIDGVLYLTRIEKGNPTGIDASLRVSLYEQAEAGSNNVDGWYGEKVWAFLMKPKYIINGVAGMGGIPDEEKGESLIGRAINWFRGGKKNEQSNNS